MENKQVQAHGQLVDGHVSGLGIPFILHKWKEIVPGFKLRSSNCKDTPLLHQAPSRTGLREEITLSKGDRAFTPVR